LNLLGLTSLNPEEIVEKLNKLIIGQDSAKRAVAIALRQRERRLRLGKSELKEEITPANILMRGPTGCGKTEIARRVAKLAGSPFLKVEATRFTELGIVGSDATSMVDDLVDMAKNLEIKKLKQQARAQVKREMWDIFIILKS